MHPIVLVPVLLVLAFVASPIEAQAPPDRPIPESSVVWRADDPWAASPPLPDLGSSPSPVLHAAMVEPPRPGLIRVAGGGTLGWVLGAAAGAGIGSAGSDDDGFAAMTGAMIVAPIGAAVGVHLANRGEGSLLLSTTASLAAGTLLAATVPFLFYVVTTPHSAPLGVGMIYTVHVGSAVLVERLTSR